MAYKYKFEKILSIKEREKDEAVNIYNQAVKRFEDSSTINSQKSWPLVKVGSNLTFILRTVQLSISITPLIDISNASPIQIGYLIILHSRFA